jgi:hypothetical protein
MARLLGHGTVVFSKDYARWISSKQDMSKMDKIEGSLDQAALTCFQKKTAARKRLLVAQLTKHFCPVFRSAKSPNRSRMSKQCYRFPEVFWLSPVFNYREPLVVIR